MIGFIKGIISRKPKATYLNEKKTPFLDGARGRAFMRIYISFRAIVIFLGATCGAFMVWLPFVLGCIFLFPGFGGAIFWGIELFVINVFFMFGDHLKYPNLCRFIIFMFPSFLGFIIILLENISGFFLVVERHQALQHGSEYD